MGRQKILYIVDHIPLPLAREGFAALYQLTRDLLPSHRSHAPLCLFGVGDSVEQKFTGQVRDSETGMDFFLARYYGSAVGRFTSPDPMNLGADPTDPQSWNAYAYVRNNPLALVDPMGLCHMGADNVAYDDEPGDCGGGSVTVVAQAPPDVMPIFVSLPSLLSDNQQPMPTAPPAVTEAGVLAQPPKSGKRSDWLNNITSLFGYDQNIPLQSCFVDAALKTAADDLNPFTPGAFDLVQGALQFGQGIKYNQALTYATAKGLTYPFKSSVFRCILKTSNLLGKAADMMRLVNLDVTLTKVLAAEIRAMKNGECQ